MKKKKDKNLNGAVSEIETQSPKSKIKKSSSKKRKKSSDEEEGEEKSEISSEEGSKLKAKKEKKKAKVEEVVEEEVIVKKNDPNAVTNFRISEPLRKKLQEKGIESLFPIQAMTFNTILDGSDMVGRARTGQVCSYIPFYYF